MKRVRWLIPSLATSQFLGSWGQEPPHEGRVTRSKKQLNLASIVHEDLEELLIFSQATIGTGGPLAMNRYRR